MGLILQNLLQSRKMIQNKDNSSGTKQSPSKKTHHLRYNDFQFIKILGMGSYGKVQLVQRRGMKYALKIIQKRLLAKQGKQYQAFIQRQLMRRMKHPGVTELKTCFQDRQNLYYCLEYCEGGSFTDFMRVNEMRMTQQLKIFYLAEIVSVIEYFQKIGVVHRDLKPQNILLNQNGHVKIIDFGTADVEECKLVDQKFKQQLSAQKKASQENQYMPIMKFDQVQNQQLSQLKSEKQQQMYQQTQAKSLNLSASKRRKATFVGTCFYVPPQLLEKQVSSYASDIWALGCIIYQLYYHIPPFDGASQFQVFQKIKNIDYQFPKNQKVPEDVIDLIKKLLRKNPEERLGSNLKQGYMMSDLKAHKLFKSINFQNIFQQQIPLLMEDHNADPTQKHKQRLQKLNNIITKQYIDVLQKYSNILTYGVVQKRTFIYYNIYYLIIFKNLNILRIKVIEPGKTRQKQIDLIGKIDNKQGVPADSHHQIYFKMFTKNKIYNYRSHEPIKWINIINKRYKYLKQNKKQYQQNEKQQRQQNQKQMKQISQALRLRKVVLQQ